MEQNELDSDVIVFCFEMCFVKEERFDAGVIYHTCDFVSCVFFVNNTNSIQM